VESEPTLDESPGQVVYLVESNKFQVRANAGGDEAKRESEFLLGGTRVEKSSLFGRSSHCTGVERRRSKVRNIYLGGRGNCCSGGFVLDLRVYIPAALPRFHCSGRHSAVVRNCAKGGEIGQRRLCAGGTGMIEGISSRWLGRSGVQIEAPSRLVLIDRELEWM
jgi:hypothetical protein